LVYTVIRRCGLGEDRAADLFQDVWVAAWDGLASVQDERALPGWLATIAARTATQALRRRIRSPVIGGAAFESRVTHTPDPAPTPEQAAIEHEQQAAMRAAIGTLSERDRLLVHAFFYDSTAPSYAEIAARLGVSPETIGPLRTRCLRRLRAALSEVPDVTGTES
jgi:RNA polymerase sigma factor (sigma-70 family)